MPRVRRALARAVRAEPSRLVVAGCPLERQRRFPLEFGCSRLKEHEHLGRRVERERLDAGGDGAEARDEGGASGGDRPRRTIRP